MTTSSVNALVYLPQGAMEAAAAGHILLSMVAVSNADVLPWDSTDSPRSFGYSTLAQRLQLLIASSLTNLPFTKKRDSLSGVPRKI